MITIRCDNEVYKIIDCLSDKVSLSKTILHAHQKTRGHMHDKVEIYYFEKDGGIIQIDKEINEVKAGFYTIPSNAFHKVSNDSDGDIEFICEWGLRWDDVYQYILAHKDSSLW